MYVFSTMNYDNHMYTLKQFPLIPWNQQQQQQQLQIKNYHNPNVNAAAAADSTDHERAKNDLLQQRLTSFLEVDDISFLTPWSTFNPSSNAPPRYIMNFQPGSFFANQPCAAMEAPQDDCLMIQNQKEGSSTLMAQTNDGQPIFAQQRQPAEGDIDAQDDSETEIIIYKAKKDFS